MINNQGRFGHDDDPLIDAEHEVEELQEKVARLQTVLVEFLEADSIKAPVFKAGVRLVLAETGMVIHG